MESTTKVDFDGVVLQRLVDASLGSGCKLAGFSPIDTGFFNSIYRLDFDPSVDTPKTAIIRIGPHRDLPVLTHEQDIMSAEIEWYRMLECRSDIPTPKLLACDTSNEVLPHNFMILEEAKGKPLSEIETSLSRGNLEAIYKSLGIVTKKLHEMRGDFFGYPHIEQLQGQSWPDVLVQMIGTAISDIERLNGELPRKVEEFSSVYKDMAELVATDAKPSLIHWDLTSHNVFVDEEQLIVSSIIDWERAFWGVPEAEHHWTFAPAAFFTGYGKRKDTSSAAKKRQALYVTYVCLVMLAEAPRRNATSAIESALESLGSCMEIIQS